MVAVSIEFTPDQIADAVARMPESEAERLLCHIAARRGSSRPRPATERESELLREIAREPDGVAMSEFARLREMSKTGALDARDEAELGRVTCVLENHAAHRLQCLIELAGLRGQTVDEVTASLGIRKSDG